MHMTHFVDVQREDAWLATYGERKQIAQACRDLANHTPPGQPRDQLLEIAKMWEFVETSDLVRQHPELARGEHPDADLRAGLLALSRPL